MTRPERQRATRAVIESVIENGAFRLAYQPIVHLDTGTVSGVEALCRFNDGAATERRFRQSERLGVAAELDFVIIRRVLEELPALPDGYLAINLSPPTLLDERLGEMLLAPPVPANRIVIEVTEHARIPDYERAERILGVIRRSGIRLAVDDAGAGYSTFRHILSLRPDMIKMDRSITHDVDSDPARRTLATALVMLGGEIGATVIAEGVETMEEAAALQRAGIRRGQGFALARPGGLPVPPLAYSPAPAADLADVSVPATAATRSVAAHGLLAAAESIGAVLDMLNERPTGIGDDRYRGLVGTAQRQARHVGDALRDLVLGLPGETVELPREEAAAGEGGVGRQDSSRARAGGHLRDAADAVQAAESHLEDAVSFARSAGVTWEEIAEILGMTRQGVSKRYGRRVEH